ncbi:DoxX family protein [Galbibacter orientalis]|uniref:DoxX family protein n=1 Tax=Galbibacter orientalis TaxID=453852 RepID=UPI00308028DD
MKWYQKHTGLITEIISYLFILLFVYAALTKLLDFENFRIQLGQAPMLSVYAGWLVWIVPISEILTAFLLLNKNTRYIGLLTSLVLMVMFTTYIYIILNYASNIPCSCGGVLEKMGWKTHLIFNLSFIFIASLAIIVYRNRYYKNKSKHKSYALLSVITLLSIGAVTMLFLTSERIIYTENPFIRRYTHGITKTSETDLNGNAYYLAGVKDNKIYLGNYSSPLRVMIIDTSLHTKEIKTIKISKKDLPSIATQVRVSPPFFYLIDGQISRILKGNILNWKVLKRIDGRKQFSEYQTIGRDSIAIKTYNPFKKMYSLGILQVKDSLPYRLSPEILEKQIDGIFDVDGTLSFDSSTNQLVYVYYYRNSYAIANNHINLKQRGSTIDTITKAQLKIDTVQTDERNERKLISSLMVNPSAFASDGLLYIRSKIKGRFESYTTWEQTETIDVYELSSTNYKSSFYVYKESGESVRRFFIIGKSFYGFAGNKLVRYDLKQML